MAVFVCVVVCVSFFKGLGEGVGLGKWERKIFEELDVPWMRIVGEFSFYF